MRVRFDDRATPFRKAPSPTCNGGGGEALAGASRAQACRPQSGAAKFRSYTVDFVRVPAKLIVEIDGAQHAIDGRIRSAPHRGAGAHGTYRSVSRTKRSSATSIACWSGLRLRRSEILPPVPHPCPSPIRERGSCRSSVTHDPHPHRQRPRHPLAPRLRDLGEELAHRSAAAHADEQPRSGGRREAA